MRAPLRAGCRVRGGKDAREPPTKSGASALIKFYLHFREGLLCFLARALGRKT